MNGCMGICRNGAAVLIAAVLLAGCSEKPESLVASARELLARNDRAGAMIHLRNALQKNSDLAEARFLLGETLLDPSEFETYASTFTRTGFRGGINWYRNFDRNWETAPEVGVAKLELPCLMVTAQWDWALRPEFAAGMPALVADLEMQQIAECGHWTQQEKPAELNRILADWLGRRFGS